MLRHIPKPLNPGRFERHIWVQPPRHGPVNDGLLLLVQQFNEPPLGFEEAVDAEVQVADEADNGFLFFGGGTAKAGSDAS